MSDRDRLIELIKQVNFDFSEECVACLEDGYKATPMLEEFFADYLLANGIIVPLCKVGDKVAVRACCECVQTIPDSDECRYICPFEDDCECEDCDDTNERIFITTIDSIYDNGFGWKVTFNNLPIIEANITNLGTSFFVGENAEQQAKEYEAKLKECEGK